jgi:aminoglycoside 3-N-acetyltransferase
MTDPAPLIDPRHPPLTVGLLVRAFASLGVSPGMEVIVHTRMSAIGWIVGGAEALIEALQRAVTPSGTLMMPTHTSDNSDPSHWQNPPVPESWWQIIRDTMPPYDPARTPTWNIGRVPELFRTYPGVIRSAHPQVSFAAWGARAAHLCADHALSVGMGEGSPLARLYDLDGHVLLIGVDQSVNTSLHLAEHRADWTGRAFMQDGCAMLVDGRRSWVAYTRLDEDADDFAALGADYERDHQDAVRVGRVGRAEVRLMRVRPLIDYAVGWLARHRPFAESSAP